MNILALTPGCSGYPIIVSYSKVAKKVFLLGFRKYEDKFNFQLEQAKKLAGKEWKNNIELIYVDSWLEYYKKAKEIINTEQVNSVLTQEPFGCYIGKKILRGYDCKLVHMMCQDYISYVRASDRKWWSKYPLMFMNWYCMRRSYPRANTIVLSKDLFERAKKYGSKKVSLLPIYGINMDLFKPVKKKKDKLFQDIYEMVIVARLSPEKGHKYLFKALQSFMQFNPKFILHVIGAGPLKEGLEELRDNLGLNGRVFFYGYLEHKDIVDFYNSSDLFILPSVEEGLGYVSGEALACECPVIASCVGGIPDIIIDGNTGLLFESMNHISLLNNLNFMYKNRDRAIEMAQRGRKHIENNYDSKKVMDKFEEILLDLKNEPL